MRDHSRVHARYEVNAQVGGAVPEGAPQRIQNISLGGICIQTAIASEIGAIVDVVIHFPDLAHDIALRGQVVWANRTPPMDLGIRWIDVDAERRALLSRYIEQVKTRELSGPFEKIDPSDL